MRTHLSRGLARLVCVLCLLAGPAGTTWAAAGFSFNDVDGHPHSLKQHHGKWVVLNFWATWCPPCIAEMPDFEAAWQARRQKDLVVIGVATDWEQSQEVLNFARKLGVHYPIVLGNDDIVDQVGGFSGLPATFIFNPDGKLVFSHVGALDRATLEQKSGGGQNPSRGPLVGR